MIALEQAREALPREGLFAQKEWLLSPEPLRLEAGLVREMEGLGHRLRVFYRACEQIYRRSVKGTLPGWVAGYVDAGKPEWLLEAARGGALAGQVPRVIRPDLLWTEEGLIASELDSVPGGLGLTAWLNELYEGRGDWQVVGGRRGMLEGFRSILPRGADILVSEEAGSYRPEMQWLAERLNREAAAGNGMGRHEVCAAEGHEVREGRAVYRFFELFDLGNIAGGRELVERAGRGEVEMTPAPKPWLEEKLWMALFRLRPLREVWRRELSENQFRRLQEVFPQTWVMDPARLPHHAEIPGLGIQDFGELAHFTQKERELVLKLSGFHEQAWGARSVVIGHDVSQQEWAEAVGRALAAFPEHPRVLQRFHRARVIEHPYFERGSGEVRMMRGRARLCPYYFVSAEDERVRLGGVLATICPEDKKILHGMKDAILVPCATDGGG